MGDYPTQENGLNWPRPDHLRTSLLKLKSFAFLYTINLVSVVNSTKKL